MSLLKSSKTFIALATILSSMTAPAANVPIPPRFLDGSIPVHSMDCVYKGVNDTDVNYGKINFKNGLFKSVRAEYSSEKESLRDVSTPFSVVSGHSATFPVELMTTEGRTATVKDAAGYNVELSFLDVKRMADKFGNLEYGTNSPEYDRPVTEEQIIDNFAEQGRKPSIMRKPRVSFGFDTNSGYFSATYRVFAKLDNTLHDGNRSTLPFVVGYCDLASAPNIASGAVKLGTDKRLYKIQCDDIRGQELEKLSFTYNEISRPLMNIKEKNGNEIVDFFEDKSSYVDNLFPAGLALKYNLLKTIDEPLIVLPDYSNSDVSAERKFHFTGFDGNVSLNISDMKKGMTLTSLTLTSPEEVDDLMILNGIYNGTPVSGLCDLEVTSQLRLNGTYKAQKKFFNDNLNSLFKATFNSSK